MCEQTPSEADDRLEELTEAVTEILVLEELYGEEETED